MKKIKLSKDPYNVIITGVGGQGNVMASRVLGNMLVRKGLHVTIGETFGSSQRGGSVMSHLRISADSTFSPQIPKGGCDLVVSLEPIEAIKVLVKYGNPEIKILTNTRPIYPVQVIAGESDYPSESEIKEILADLNSSNYYINATEEAIGLGNPIFANIIMIGAIGGMDMLPVDEDDFKEVISRTVPADKLDMNLKAYKLGESKIRNYS